MGACRIVKSWKDHRSTHAGGVDPPILQRKRYYIHRTPAPRQSPKQRTRFNCTLFCFLMRFDVMSFAHGHLGGLWKFAVIRSIVAHEFHLQGSMMWLRVWTRKGKMDCVYKVVAFDGDEIEKWEERHAGRSFLRRNGGEKVMWECRRWVSSSDHDRSAGTHSHEAFSTERKIPSTDRKVPHINNLPCGICESTTELCRF